MDQTVIEYPRSKVTISLTSIHRRMKKFGGYAVVCRKKIVLVFPPHTAIPEKIF
jgi:hypothetical protein